MEKIKVLFVCMGNICRSPTAEGVFHHVVSSAGLTRHFEIDSAGTNSSHSGQAPDVRAQQAAKARGVDLSKLKARKVDGDDFTYFDYIFAMDKDNLSYLTKKCPPELNHKLSLFLSHAPELGIDEVPDPYYGPKNGFDRVLEMLWRAADGLLTNLKAQHGLR